MTELLLREDVRLVTLIGPGGIGKTRLSLQIATNAASAFPGGVFFVDLSAILDARAVPSTISLALGVRGAGNKTLFENIKELLREATLLILDNFEQLMEAAPLVKELLVHCPEVKVLVTSRAALALTGEYEYHVEPLTLPGSGLPADLSELLKYEALAFLVQQIKNVGKSLGSRSASRELQRSFTVKTTWSTPHVCWPWLQLCANPFTPRCCNWPLPKTQVPA